MCLRTLNGETILPRPERTFSYAVTVHRLETHAAGLMTCSPSRDREGGNTLNREQKAQVVEDLNAKFQRAKGVVVAEYKGLTVEDMNAVRGTLRSADLEFAVIKNTLARRAVEGTSCEPVKDAFHGPVGVALGYDDPVVLAKKVLAYAKTSEFFNPTGAVIEGKVCDVDALKAVAALPSRDAMLGQVAGLFQAPAQKMARLLNATVSQLGYALTALHAKRGEE